MLEILVTFLIGLFMFGVLMLVVGLIFYSPVTFYLMMLVLLGVIIWILESDSE